MPPARLNFKIKYDAVVLYLLLAIISAISYIYDYKWNNYEYMYA